MMQPRVRFAPAPTGELHVGGARTALFNWLFARHYGGDFILRIEDTDKSRSTEESIGRIKEAFLWLGLEWDEYYRQTERFPLYESAAEKLLAEGKAYEHEGAWWFKMPKSGATIVQDKLLGKVSFDNSELKDWVIRRSDGSFTYNFACVVDDLDLKITHVIRANEHLNNTPRQILIYQALGAEPPVFAHLPMVLGLDRSKLSKRHGATSVLEYREMGFLPEALINFLARLGWAHGDQEIFSKEELIELFSLEAIGKSSAVFNEDKLLWLNQHYIKSAEPTRLGELLREFLVKRVILSPEEASAIKLERLIAAADLLKERSKNLVELAEKARFIFSDDFEYDPKGVEKFFTAERVPLLKGLVAELFRLKEFTAARIEEATRLYLEREGRKLGEIAQTCRLSLTGKTEGPGLFETMEVLGRATVIARLQQAIALSTKES